MEEINFAEQLARLRQEFDLVCERMSFGQHSFEFYRIADPDALLDDATLQQGHEEMVWHPYWALISPAAYGLAHEIAQRDWSDKQVLDLGCGVGLTGCVAAAGGASVLFSDFAPPALRFASVNSYPWCDRVEVQRCDWRSEGLGREFDLILGSDIVYDRDDVEFLSRFWSVHLSANGEVWLGDPQRSITSPMLERLPRLGWQVNTQVGTWNGQAARILRLSRSPAR